MWTQTYGGSSSDFGRAVVQTSDGGFAIAGSTLSFGAGDEDFYLVRVDACGRLLWNQTFGGVESDRAYSLVATADGGFAIAGYTYSFGVGYCNFWLVRTDANGNMLWNQTYGGADIDVAYSLVATADGGFAIVGCTYSFGVGFSDFWLVRTDADGRMLWNQTYGRANIDIAYSLVVTSDGGFAIAGSSDGDFWLVRTDADGRMLWNQIYVNSVSKIPKTVVVTSDGGFAIAGYTVCFVDGPEDFWLVKTDANGNLLWNQTYGGADIDEAYSLVELSDGGFAIAGSTLSFGAGFDDAWVVRTDANGRLLWNQTFGGAGFDHAEALVVASDGGLVIAGYTNSFSGLADDFWLFKLASDTVPAPKPEPESDLAMLFTTAGVITAVAVIVAGVAMISRFRKIRR